MSESLIDYHKYIELLLSGMCTSLSLSIFHFSFFTFDLHTQVCVHHQDQLSCKCSKYPVSTRRRRLIVSILFIHDSKVFFLGNLRTQSRIGTYHSIQAHFQDILLPALRNKVTLNIKINIHSITMCRKYISRSYLLLIIQYRLTNSKMIHIYAD